ncbi:hypothetical protein KDL29_12710 [bacterium]|nr:hypothetical protein [bacterium]MCB1221496.1 hypothetical protein [bacterium]UNM09317.1 MAG: hypothetical protein H7A35_04495 [Planctomycetales bacterium]
MLPTCALLRYGMGYGYGLFTSPVSNIIMSVLLIWIGISGMLSSEGKYDNRSYFEMNAAYIFSLLLGLVLGAYGLRRLLPGE